MKKQKDEVVVFPDSVTIVMTGFLFLLFSVSSVLIWYITTLPNTIGSPTAIMGSRLLAVGIGLCLPVLFIVDPERYIIWFRFKSEGIEYHVLFRKMQLLPYSNFPSIMLGKYLHGVYWRYFIVFSNRRLSDSELRQVNHIVASKELIKIRYSENTKRTLTSILPPKQKRSVLAMTPSQIEKRL